MTREHKTCVRSIGQRFSFTLLLLLLLGNADRAARADAPANPFVDRGEEPGAGGWCRRIDVRA